jgi:hypothetical protein
MATITSTVRAGQGPSNAEWARIKAELREAKKHPIVYDEDCPKLTPAQLAEFKPVDSMTWEERAGLLAARKPARSGQAPSGGLSTALR